MWLIKLILKFIVPTALVLLFSLLCIMFVWNQNSFTTNPFNNIRQTWFNINSEGFAVTPSGILGKAVCNSNESIWSAYGDYNSLVQGIHQIQGNLNNLPNLVNNIKIHPNGINLLAAGAPANPPADVTPNIPQSGLPTNLLGWFSSRFIKMGAIVFLMPIGVSLLFGIVSMTVISILWKIIVFLFKRARSQKKS